MPTPPTTLSSKKAKGKEARSWVCIIEHAKTIASELVFPFFCGATSSEGEWPVDGWRSQQLEARWARLDWNHEGRWVR